MIYDFFPKIQIFVKFLFRHHIYPHKVTLGDKAQVWKSKIIQAFVRLILNVHITLLSR